MKITFFKSEWDTFVPEEMSLDATWDEVAEMLTTFVKVVVKEDTEMYNLWEFKVTDGQIHRCKDDCVALHGLVLDYDQNLRLEDALEQFAGFEAVIYTTFNHGIEGKDKFRIVIPFTKPMPIAEFNKKRKSMIDGFPGVDRASFSRSQAIFLHSGPDKNNAFSARLSGIFLDWEVFEDEEIIPYVQTKEPVQVDDAVKQAYRAAVIDALKECRGFRHMTSLSLAIILKSCGASFADYCAIVARCGDKDSCIHNEKSKHETWAAVPDDVRIGRDKRDRFIVKHGGKPVKVGRVSVLESKIQKLKEELGYGS